MVRRVVLLSRVSVLALATLFIAACGPGNNGSDAGPDTGVAPGPDVAMVPDGALTCATWTAQCQAPAVAYGLCCNSCPTGLSCAYANPGVDAGMGTAVMICTKLCGTGADCPSGANGAASWCVRGLCYQSCDAAGSTCPTGEDCVMLYGHGICEAVTCF